MEIDASCVVRLCNFRAPVTVRISSAVLFTRRGREDDPSVRIYPSIPRDRAICARSLDRSITRCAPRCHRSSNEIRRVHQSSLHCRSHSSITPVDYAQFIR